MPTEGSFDEAINAFVVRITPRWIVGVHPMLVNHRITITAHADYPASATAGWCYDDHMHALAAAVVFDPEQQRAPVGYAKLAYDLRNHVLGCQGCSRQEYDVLPTCSDSWCKQKRRPVEDVQLPQ